MSASKLEQREKKIETLKKELAEAHSKTEVSARACARACVVVVPPSICLPVHVG